VPGSDSSPDCARSPLFWSPLLTTSKLLPSILYRLFPRASENRCSPDVNAETTIRMAGLMATTVPSGSLNRRGTSHPKERRPSDHSASTRRSAHEGRQTRCRESGPRWKTIVPIGGQDFDQPSQGHMGGRRADHSRIETPTDLRILLSLCFTRTSSRSPGLILLNRVGEHSLDDLTHLIAVTKLNLWHQWVSWVTRIAVAPTWYPHSTLQYSCSWSAPAPAEHLCHERALVGSF
jgi:hypothetical protein